MVRMLSFGRICAALAMTLGVATLSFAQGKEAPQLPADPTQWINAAPLTNEALAGKAVVLWYFEETCPRCREKWPGLIELSKQFEGKPVIFIAVNSGTPRASVEQYARQNRIPWPIIVDSSRAFERASDVTEISLSNITQIKFISAEGKLVGGDWANVPGTVEKALAGARWRVDPAGLPGVLKAAWQSVEFGDFVTAAPAIKKALGNNKADVKAAAEKLDAYISESLNSDIAKAEQLASSGQDKWEAYKLFRDVANRYKGYDLPADFRAKGKELHGDADVKAQLALLKELEDMKKPLGSPSAVVRQKTAARLKKFAADHPNTDAGQQAEEWLTQLPQNAAR